MTGQGIRNGTSLEGVEKQTIDASHRAEVKDYTSSLPILVFEDFRVFLATFSDARIALLKHLAATGPAASINALATAIGRPYRRVHDDVTALAGAGVLKREGRQVVLPYSGVSATMNFRKRAA